jgi:hypothetical protein
MSLLQILIKLKKAKETRTRKVPKRTAEKADSDIKAEEDDTLPEEIKVDESSKGPSAEAGDSADIGKDSNGDALAGEKPSDSAQMEASSSGEEEEGDEEEAENPTDDDVIEEKVEETPHWYQLRGD